MVKLTEVEDEHFSEKPAGKDGEVLLTDNDDDYTDTDSEISSDAGSAFSDLGPPPESLSDRILALRDMVPPGTRAKLSSTLSTLYNVAGNVAGYGGKGLWVLVTSAMLMGIPYALAMTEEQQIIEEEKRQGMINEGANAMLAGEGVQGNTAL